VRLLREATRHGTDPELFAGLVHVCRYCGLFDESIAAHDEARRLDPNVPTSLAQTFLLAGAIERLRATARPAAVAGGDQGILAIGLGLAGRRDEAHAALDEMIRFGPRIPVFETWTDHLRAWLDRRVPEMLLFVADTGRLKITDDPEAIFQEGLLLCDVGDHKEGLPLLARGIEKGYSVSPTLMRSPQFDALRGTPEFEALVAEAERGRQRALAAFRDAGGDRLLGR
jgi:hypothetical protein